jgi:mono/diheme cytochrome c family protein/HEAT repeat protein
MSSDERFRPVYLSNAPDGALYLVDMYHGIIQHRDYITEYLRDQILSRKLEAPSGHGRIYRIVHDTTRRAPLTLGPQPQTIQLVDLLSHPNGWWRDTAQRLLVERGDVSAVAALTKLASSAPLATTRLHALWTLDGLDSLEPRLVTGALRDPSRDVRVSALRLAEKWIGGDAKVESAVLALLTDPDWAVRRQLAASLGALPFGAREAPLAALLGGHGDDPVTVDAALSGARGSEPAILDLLLRSPNESTALSAAITMTAGTIVRRGDATMQDLFDMVADGARPAWQRSAVLRGAEAALLGQSMPGGGGRGAGGGGRQNAGAAPGTRGGPGGSPAFPRAGESGRGRGAFAPITLGREPAIAALARNDSAGGDSAGLGSRAAAVLARLTWPGKGDAAPAATPLTPEEQQRFNDGRELYQSLCAACHQPDGRGRDQLAPPLVGSDFALASPDIPVRIVLGGKEGSVGLMPPLGAALTDDQVAAALTYIRREWGHTASPVSPSVVRDVRAATAGRTRPWTADELEKIRQ